jgi:hypothetical protein
MTSAFKGCLPEDVHAKNTAAQINRIPPNIILFITTDYFLSKNTTFYQKTVTLLP